MSLLWIDAQLPPAIARWITAAFDGVTATAVRDLRLRAAEDLDIFIQARTANAILVSKDGDFVDLLERHGPPPRLIWITCGNTSNARLREVLGRDLATALDLIARGERMVEIGG